MTRSDVLTGAMALKSRITLVITFPRAPAPLRCHGTVRWSYAHSEAGKFVVGVEFDPLSEKQLQQVEAAR